VGDGDGLFNFFGSPDASRFGELDFLDRSAGGDRRACTLSVNSRSETAGEFGLVMRNGAGFAYGLTINAAGHGVAGGNTWFTSTCLLEAVNGFFHQTGELGFFGVGPAPQQAVATADFLKAVDHAAGMNDRWLFLTARGLNGWPSMELGWPTPARRHL
jgi:hypothetical protein